MKHAFLFPNIRENCKSSYHRKYVPIIEYLYGLLLELNNMSHLGKAYEARIYIGLSGKKRCPE
jgi:hypothetical protein